MTEQNGVSGSQDEVLSRIGHLTRSLHDSLRGLGLDKLIERAASDIPDARDRLDYVARLSEQAAQRVLNATDAASPLQDRIDVGSTELAGRWQQLLDGAGEGDWRALAAATVAQLEANRQDAAATRAQLIDIMMAQDFQDLTGQVISRVTALAQSLEQQLVELLVDFAPAEIKRDYDNGLVNGPQINPEGNGDVVANQSQVDDLLDSLGF
ncbi:MAG: protein phosphatase CheZ [Telluria sp.]